MTAAADDDGLLTLRIGPVAHGGHCVARHEGRVVFVRHTLPGELVRGRLTQAGATDKFWRADAVEVLEASPDRTAHFWPEADAAAAYARGSLPVGGAEFGHISLAAQRPLKAEVIAEQLHRLAGVDREILVEDAEDTEDIGADAGTPGLGWRTRVAFGVTADGRLGMHPHRSDQVLPVRQMPLAVAAVNELRLWEADLSGVERVDVAAPANGSRPLVLLAAGQVPERRLAKIAAGIDEAASVARRNPATGAVERLRGRAWVSETAAGREYRVSGEGFWQIHRNAPAVLTGAVLEYLSGHLHEGARVADLYAGAGLFTGPLSDAVGPSGSVLSVEGSPGTSRDARKNFHTSRQVEIVQGRVERVLHGRSSRFDAVVLDPPRAGAGKAVVRQLIESAPRAIAYVSCDPASFARDVGYFQAGGWKLAGLRGFDLYPHTHHVETVALLTPAG
ncbi:TRAM domain-containing protein [Paenarthrobacter sp. DKR-5]|uniref:class I SAM-dependent RNA methyltransferase n=1 Tax=Paenarthrobacter sp. DKR-5 TaxID=2835535 RepID=UPI001BDDA3AB|nr:TRAM domain-containing protein [Paenarthrobacter sp. DKR-5]MBT1002083.1 TRAM domain-containing protein [Paenarthrobacter sp. DKR-5]